MSTSCFAPVSGASCVSSAAVMGDCAASKTVCPVKLIIYWLVMNRTGEGRSLGCAIQLQEGRQRNTGADESLVKMVPGLQLTRFV